MTYASVSPTDQLQTMCEQWGIVFVDARGGPITTEKTTFSVELSLRGQEDGGPGFPGLGWRMKASNSDPHGNPKFVVACCVATRQLEHLEKVNGVYKLRQGARPVLEVGQLAFMRQRLAARLADPLKKKSQTGVSMSTAVAAEALQVRRDLVAFEEMHLDADPPVLSAIEVVDHEHKFFAVKEVQEYFNSRWGVGEPLETDEYEDAPEGGEQGLERAEGALVG